MLLLTGASGLLGASAALAAEARGLQITTVSTRTPLGLPSAANVALDLIASGGIEELIERTRPRWILHCAALTDVDRCEREPQLAAALNAEVTARIARAGRGAGARLLAVSTDAVFDGRSGSYCETDATGPLNVYARTKLEGELAVAAEAGEDWLVARTSIYGWSPREGRRSLAEFFLEELRAGREPAGFEDLRFSPMLANDAAEAMLDLLASNAVGIFHVAGSQSISKYDFGVAVAKAFDLDALRIKRSNSDRTPTRAPRPRDVSLSTEKVERTLGRSMPNVDAGLDRMRALQSDGTAARLRALAR